MDSAFFVSRVLDTAKSCERNCIPKFLGFLTTEEAAIAQSTLKKAGAKFSFFGGYDEAERVYLGCLPEWCEEISFPIVPITFSYRNEDKLTHRDFLGSLMALGLTREKIGDILVEPSRTVAFVCDTIADHIVSQIDKVGRVGVTLKKGCEFPLPSMSVLSDFTVTLASLRLDCVISSVCGCSRSKASELITGGLVSINSILCDKVTKCVNVGEKITVRGSGKFIIDSLGGISKKGKTILNYKKYI